MGRFEDALRRVVSLLYETQEAEGGWSGEWGIELIENLDRQQAEQVLLALTAARLGPLMMRKGWAAWSRVEALAALS